MSKAILVHLPNELYQELLKRAETEDGVAKEIVAVVQEGLSTKRHARSPSLRDIIGIAEGEEDLVDHIDDIVYGPSA